MVARFVDVCWFCSISDAYRENPQNGWIVWPLQRLHVKVFCSPSRLYATSFPQGYD